MPPSVPIDKPPVLFVFEGLLLGFHDATSHVYEVGVIPACEHQFSITVNEFQVETVVGDEERIPIQCTKLDFLDFPPDRRIWTFEVEQADPVAKATVFETGTILNRRGPTPGTGDPVLKDHRWAISLDDEKDFPLHGELTKQPAAINPIVRFKHGTFYNRGLITRPKIFRKRLGQPREELGKISDRFAANIEDIKTGGRMLLRDGLGHEILNLVLKEQRCYSIFVRNRPARRQEHEHASGAGHFPLFYSAFIPSRERYDLTALADQFPDSAFEDESPSDEGGRGAPAPFRCGIGRVKSSLSD